jgi:hypothetical protein
MTTGDDGLSEHAGHDVELYASGPSGAFAHCHDCDKDLLLFFDGTVSDIRADKNQETDA